MSAAVEKFLAHLDSPRATGAGDNGKLAARARRPQAEPFDRRR